jgi:glycosyltransferase involved in cell wall biosynthesis
MIHIGLVGPLPPVQTGPADYLANMLPGLARHAEITVFVPDPAAVDASLRREYRVRPLTERDDPKVDVLIYHIANNPEQIPSIDAALEGPPGLLEIHDGSQHHLVAHRFGDFASLDKYAEILEAAHGRVGARLAELRRSGPGLQSELFLFDLLRPLIERHRGVIVHNQWAADLVEMRSPGTPTWIVPHFAPKPPSAAPRSALGLPEDRLLIAHLGYVTLPKRPGLMVSALAGALDNGINAHLVFGGAADPTARQLLENEVTKRNLDGRVTLTGYLSRADLDRLVSAVDIVVNLRFPHLGESSGVLAEAMAAGRPVIVHSVGGWADLPDDAVLRTPLGGGELRGLVESLVHLSDPGHRARMGRAAQIFATTTLDLDRCAGELVRAAEASVREPMAPARDVMRERSEAVRAWVVTHPEHPFTAGAIPPARPGARLLDVAGRNEDRHALATVWAYDVVAHDGPIPSRGLPFPAASFSMVTMAGSESVAGEDPMLSLVEANRVLRAGGVLALAPGPWTNAGIAPPDLERLLQSAGFVRDLATPDVVAGHKAGLPIERYPDEFYGARWIKQLQAS